MGDRPTPGEPFVAFGDDHDVSTTHRHDVHPVLCLLDFWLPDGAVELIVYAHSIDFGAKGYANLVELAWLQRHVADALGVPVGRLLMIIKSAHVYETELNYIEGVLAGNAAGPSKQRSEGAPMEPAPRRDLP
jgi:thymidylate synthase